VSPLRGEKPIFGLLSKNNTGMAALSAVLPVIKSKTASTSKARSNGPLYMLPVCPGKM